MKILLSSIACEPNKGSEPGVGWNWAMNLSAYHDVYIVTSLGHKEKIEEYMQKGNITNLPFHVYYYGFPALENIKTKIPYGYNVYCYLWQKTLYRFINNLNNKIHFDLCHHLTYASFKYESCLYKLNIPFIFGPIGGGEKTPDNLVKLFNIKDRIFDIIRNIQIKRAVRSKKIQETLKGSTKILVTTEDTLKLIPEPDRAKCEIMQAIGIDKSEINLNKNNIIKDNTVKLLFVGEMKSWKGLDLIIRLAIKLKENNGDKKFLINMVGGGHNYKDFIKKINSNHLEDIFHMYGKVPHDKVMKLYLESNIFLYPSYHDSGAMVVLEAMSKCIPVIVLNTGGPGFNVTDNTGFKISRYGDIDTIINNFYHEIIRITKLIENNEISKYTLAAVKSLEENYIWERKAIRMLELYNEVIK